MNAKLAQFTENAMKFTMDGGMSLDEFKDEDEEDNTDYKKMYGEPARSVMICMCLHRHRTAQDCLQTCV